MEANFIYPGQENLNYLAKKWRVSAKEINDAILHTGSLNPDKIHEYITRDSWLHHPAKGIKQLIKSTVNYIF